MKKKCLYSVISILLAAALLLGLNQQFHFLPFPNAPAKGNTAFQSYLVAAAKEPKVTPFPDAQDYVKDLSLSSSEYDKAYEAWEKDWEAARLSDADRENLPDFLFHSIPSFFQEGFGENRIYSPLNLYIALAMLTETTSGNSQKQLLDVLEADSLSDLRNETDKLWSAAYRNDGYVTSILGNSLWLDESASYNQDTANLLAKDYHASTFTGQMGSDEFNDALHDWMNQQTGNLLQDQIQNLGFDPYPNSVLGLVSTIYYSASWTDSFYEGYTAPGTFYLPEGVTTCDFMKSEYVGTYYWSDHFSAISKSLDNSGSMWLILPDEGYTPETILQEEATLDFLADPENWNNQKSGLQITLKLPKFDISSQLDLEDILIDMGITDVFDGGLADFSNIFSDLPEDMLVALSKVLHGARVKVDEEGCEAAAYTFLQMAGDAAPPDKKVDFTLDRPFLFAIINEDGLPLFVGTVNQL